MPQLFAGAAKVNITPYVGARMAGFASRDHGCEGVHDELHARAVVLRAGETRVALVGCELIGLSVESVRAIRQRVEAETGIPAGHVMVGCTHTHSGPSLGRPGGQDVDAELVHVTERKVAGAAIAASRGMAEASLGVGKGSVRIGVNRRERQPDGSFRLGKNPEGPVDEEVGVLRFNGSDGRPIALCVVYACHAVVLGPRNYLISADYPGQAVTFLEGVHPGAVCPFFQSTCGNINAVPVGGTFGDARRLGLRLGAEALQVAERTEASPDVALAVVQGSADVPLAPLPPVEEARRSVAERERELDAMLARGEMTQERREGDFRLRWARGVLAECEKPEHKTAETLPLQALRLGDALLVTTPGETFVEIGLAIKAASPLPDTFVLGYTNGYMGYLPTAKAFEEGGYEPNCARPPGGAYVYAPGIEAALTQAGIELAHRGLEASPLGRNQSRQEAGGSRQ